jgi:hypothetical protein
MSQRFTTKGADMRLIECDMKRWFALTAVATVTAMVLGLGWGTSADAVPGNLACEKTGSLELATGGNNLACGFHALQSDTTGYET